MTDEMDEEMTNMCNLAELIVEKGELNAYRNIISKALKDGKNEKEISEFTGISLALIEEVKKETMLHS